MNFLLRNTSNSQHSPREACPLYKPLQICTLKNCERKKINKWLVCKVIHAQTSEGLLFGFLVVQSCWVLYIFYNSLFSSRKIMIYILIFYLQKKNILNVLSSWVLLKETDRFLCYKRFVYNKFISNYIGHESNYYNILLALVHKNCKNMYFEVLKVDCHW